MELLNINGGCLGDSWLSRPRIHVHGIYRVRQSCVLELESMFSGKFSLHKRVKEWKSDKHFQWWGDWSRMGALAQPTLATCQRWRMTWNASRIR